MKKLFAAVLAALSFGASSVYAAIPAVVGTSLTAVQTDALGVIDLVWPVVMAIIGGFVLIKIAKRGVKAL